MNSFLHDSPSKSDFKSLEWVHKMTSCRIQAMHNSLSLHVISLTKFAFNCLKYSSSSFVYNDFEESIPGGTFQTSAQARSVLMKSENLCKRVNSLVDKFSSHYVSQDSCESVSSRVNLHIPRGSLTDTPLSPLSMGGLDTDRISCQIEETEAVIAEYDLLLKVWREWKYYAEDKRIIKEKRSLAEGFFSNKIYRKIFAFLKRNTRSGQQKKMKNTLARGSFVQKILRKVMMHMKSRLDAVMEKREKFRVLKYKKMKSIMKEWKIVTVDLIYYNGKIKKHRQKWNARISQKYFKYFAIMSMIISRQQRQRKIAEDYNRERLLTLGFLHLSISNFTNKYFDNLDRKANFHYEKMVKKRYFDTFYVNFLMLKRFRVVKSTGNRIYRRNFLIKGMRRLYSFCSSQKNSRNKLKEAVNYYTSNLYLKTVVSWQNYHNIMKDKGKSKKFSYVFYRKKYLKKCFSGWKKWYPNIKRIRTTGESIETEKRYWIMKDLLLEWTVKTKKRIENRERFENTQDFRRQFKVFNAWKEYSEKRYLKIEYFQTKIYQLQLKIAKRVLLTLKTFSDKQKVLSQAYQRLIYQKAKKFYSRWRKVFVRKIHLTPIVIKRFCIHLFRRWKRYVQGTSLQFKKKQNAIKYSASSLKSKVIRKWEEYSYRRRRRRESYLRVKSIKDYRTCHKAILVLKSHSLYSRVQKLKILKSEDHFSYITKRKIFFILLNNKSTLLESDRELEKVLSQTLINSLSIKRQPKPNQHIPTKPLESLQTSLLKSKGIFRWFNYVKTHKNKSNDISSILSNSLNINVSEGYFQKEKVYAIQKRRQKLAKKILAHWRLFVDIIKKKHQLAQNFFKKSQTKKVKKYMLSWKKYHDKKQRLYRRLNEKNKLKQEKSAKECLKAWKNLSIGQKENNIKIKYFNKKRLSKWVTQIFTYWKRCVKYKITMNKMAHNYCTIRRYKLVLFSLKQNVSDRSSFLNRKATNFYLGKIMTAWHIFMKNNWKKERVKSELKRKSEAFFSDIGCIRGLRRLKQYAENRLLLKKADEFYFKSSLQKGIARWSGYYFNYLKVMKKARLYDIQRQSKRKSFCLKKWFYVSHLNSWKNRAEKRLFFYWDRRLKRILFTWRTIVDKKFTNYDKVWAYRVKLLKVKTFEGLKMQRSILKEKCGKDQKSLRNRVRIQLSKVFRALKVFHVHSRKKLNKLTKALSFRYYKSCSMFLSLWESTIKSTKSKKIRVKKLYNSYLRSFAVSRFGLKLPSVQSFLRSKSAVGNDHLLSYFESLQASLPKYRNYTALNIFFKWRSISACKATASLSKSSNFSQTALKSRIFNSWSKALQLAKFRRKTLRSAIIFHRTKLKKKAFYSWKPKKVIRRRK